MSTTASTLPALLDFISESPTSYHATDNVASILKSCGWEELDEKNSWNGALVPNQGYFAIRDGSALIAFITGDPAPMGYRVFAAHTDSPAFKLKEHPEKRGSGLVRLNVEGYGGMISRTWLDRPLSIAGRIHLSTDSGISSHLFDWGEPVCIIPSAAIHIDKNVNSEGKLSIQENMLPLFAADDGSNDSFLSSLASKARVDEESVIGYDLFLYPKAAPCVLGASGEFMAAPRFDDLACVCAGAFAISALPWDSGSANGMMPVLALFDNEEVGSRSARGADSTFLEDILSRIAECYGMGANEQCAALANSFMLSADNGHAEHPAYASKADPTNGVRLNGGIVIKHAASQSYCTSGRSAAYVKMLCKEAGIPFQIFHNNSDERGGSTLGNISLSHVSMESADIGLAQLAMHSAYETMGSQDAGYMRELASAFWSHCG